MRSNMFTAIHAMEQQAETWDLRKDRQNVKENIRLKTETQILIHLGYKVNNLSKAQRLCNTLIKRGSDLGLCVFNTECKQCLGQGHFGFILH